MDSIKYIESLAEEFGIEKISQYSLCDLLYNYYVDSEEIYDKDLDNCYIFIEHMLKNLPEIDEQRIFALITHIGEQSAHHAFKAGLEIGLLLNTKADNSLQSDM